MQDTRMSQEHTPFVLFFWLTNAEKPPSIALASTATLPIETDLHRAVGGRGDLEPVLSNI